jgi:RNA 2',3'-cyclic 3'-phosphodiesterase
MRLFVAIDLDDAARVAIADEQKRLMRAFGRSDRSLRGVRPEQMHLTLVFIGNIDDGRTPSLMDAMREDIGMTPFTIAFARTGVFPPHGAPSILWLGVSHGASDAVSVQRIVADRLEKFGVERERRAYYPHLTLGRWRASRASDRRRAAEASRVSEVARIDVEAVTLYRSHFGTPGRGVGDALATARLSGTCR